MKTFFRLRQIALSLALLSSFQWAMAPLAQAKQAQKQQEESMRQALKELGLERINSMTYGQIWKQIRGNFSNLTQSKLDLLAAASANDKLENFQITNLKGSRGQDVLRMSYQQGGLTGTFEFDPENPNFIRFNGKALALSELENIDQVLEKLKDDPLVKKDLAETQRRIAQMPTVPTYKAWLKMTPYERAHFMVTWRLIHESSQEILKNANPQKTSMMKLMEEDPILRWFLGENAEAAQGGKARPGVKKSKVSDTAVGEPCIIAGYWEGRITTNKVCTLNDEKTGAVPENYTRGCSSSGSSISVACNPVLFGYNRQDSSKPVCVPYELGKPETNNATAGGCESGSPLRQKNGVVDPNDVYGMIKSILMQKNKMGDDEIRKLFTVQANADGKETLTAEKEAYEKYIGGDTGILTQFNKEKEKAQAVCDKISQNPGAFQRTNQQTNACSSLMKRVLAVQQALGSIAQREKPPGTGNCPPETGQVPANPGSPASPATPGAGSGGSAEQKPPATSPSPGSPQTQPRESGVIHNHPNHGWQRVETPRSRPTNPGGERPWRDSPQQPQACVCPPPIATPVPTTEPGRDICSTPGVAVGTPPAGGSGSGQPEGPGFAEHPTPSTDCASGRISPTTGYCDDGPVTAVREDARKPEERRRTGFAGWSTGAKLAAFGLGGVLFALLVSTLTKGKNKKPKYIPPVASPLPPVTTPPTPIAPPPAIEGGSGSSPVTGSGVNPR